MPDCPNSTVTFFFKSLEGSTFLWQEHPAAKPVAIIHDESVLRLAVERRCGVIIATFSDARRPTAAPVS